MKTTSLQTENQGSGGDKRTKLALLGLVGILLVSSLSAGLVLSAGYDHIQIFVTTGSQLPYSYTFTAYNATGSQVATYQGDYPAGAFELPSGEYLFTVSAVYQQQGYCYPCVYSQGSSSGAPSPGSTTSNNSTDSGNSTKSMPVYRWYAPKSEYGWKEVEVTTSQTININTVNVTQIPTTKVTVHVSFLNGTAASGASVSASIIGQWYYWWGEGPNVSMWGQTGSDGTVTLTLPVAPAMITAWDWVQVSLPVSKTVTVNIGGQKINVTEIWGPAYVGLSGSATLIPPEKSVSITLTYQQPTYWAEPLTAKMAPGLSSGGAASGTVANTPTGTPSQIRQTTAPQQGQNQYYQPSQIGALEALSGPVNSGGLPFVGSLPLVAAGATLVAISLLAAVVLARRQRPQSPIG